MFKASLHPGKHVYEARVGLGGAWRKSMIRIEFIDIDVRGDSGQTAEEIVREAVEHLLPPGISIHSVHEV